MSPVETDQVTLNATVRNAGTAASIATDVTFFLGTTSVGTAQVGALAAGAQANVGTTIAARPSGSYEYTAKVDETKKVAEQNETNNARVHPDPLVVTPVPSSDLVAVPSWSPSNPSNGQSTTFSVAIKNQGTIASAAGAHGITVTILNSSGQTVRTLTGSHNGTINAGATTAAVSLGTWPAADGRYTVRTVIAGDGNEIPAKQGNNTSEQSLFIGRGASVPWQHVEAEDATVGGGAQVLSPNRTIGDLAGEASGRRAVTLNGNGQSVEFTTAGPTNTLVTRFSIPDSSGGGGITSNLNVYVNGQFHKAIDLTSKYMWQYGNEAEPGNSPGAGGPRHIYDEANVMLNSTFPAGTKIKLQKDAANTTNYAIDFVNFEQVTAAGNPDAARYAVPAGFTHQDVQNALDRVRMDTTGTLIGVYLPAGTYQTAQKFTVYGKAIRVVGATSVHPVPGSARAGEHRHRLQRAVVRERVDVQRVRGVRQLHRAHQRAGQGVRLRRCPEHDHREHLGRAHDVPVLGQQRRQQRHQGQPHPRHVRRRPQPDQRFGGQPDREHRGPLDR